MKKYLSVVSTAVGLWLMVVGCGSPEPAEERSSADASQPVEKAAEAAPGEETGDPVPNVVAVIGEREVTRDEYQAELETKQRQLDAELAVLRETSRQQLPSRDLSPLSKQQTLENLVAKILLKEAAEKAGYEVTEAEIEARLAEGRANLVDADNYQEYLDWYGMTEAQLREQIRDQIMTEKYLSDQIEPCTITDAEVRAKFEEFKGANQLEGPADADFRHILLMVPPGSPDAVWEERKQEIAAIRERIQDGEDFGDLAVELSEDPSAKRNSGYYEYIQREMFVPSVDEYLFEGPIGEISDPIRASYGWHIVKVEARRDEGPRTFEQVEGRLRDSLARICDARRKQEFIEQKFAEHGVRFLYTVPGSEEQRAELNTNPAEAQ